MVLSVSPGGSIITHHILPNIECSLLYLSFATLLPLRFTQQRDREISVLPVMISVLIGYNAAKNLGKLERPFKRIQVYILF